jgi:hypothetical protein
MMKLTNFAAAGAVCVALLAPMDAFAQVAHGAAITALMKTADSLSIERAQYGGYRGGYYRGYGGYYNGGNAAGAAIAGGILGLAAGAAIAGAAANAGPPPVVMGDPNWIAYCARKYQSFDPSSGTYLGYDGYRHACQ